MGLFDKSVEDFTKAISIEPTDKTAYYWRGIVYNVIRKYNKALEDFDSAISIDKDYGDAYEGRGLTYLAWGKRKKAIADLQKACELGSKQGCKLVQQVSACLL